MRILITGASGLIGTALIDKLLEKPHSLICQSRHPQEDTQGVHWIKHNLIEDSWGALDIPDVDVIFHLAAQTSVYHAKQDPLGDLSANVLSLLHLMEHFRKQKRPPFVVLSGTATEVGLTEQLPIHEGVPDNPITFYDVSKLTAEMYLKQYIREGWLTGCILRFANVFGRSQSGQKADRGIIDKVFSQAISRKNITIYGDGDYLRDYIFIDDVIAALLMAAEHAERTNGRMFYIGNGQAITLKDAFLKVIALAAMSTGSRVEYQHIDAPDGLSDIEYRNAVVDSSAFTQATGWVPQFDFESGLNEAYKNLIRGWS